MPTFSSALISDASLDDVASYVHQSLPHAADGAATIGPRTLDPLLVGVVAWFLLAGLVAALSALFAEHAR